MIINIIDTTSLVGDVSNAENPEFITGLRKAERTAAIKMIGIIEIKNLNTYLFSCFFISSS